MKLMRWQSPDSSVWPSLGRLSDLRDEIDRLFNLPLGEMSRHTPWVGHWSPALDVYEDKDQFVVTAELPGLRKEDIQISLHNGGLTLSGERKAEEQRDEGEVHRCERYFGRFQRTLDLPAQVDGEKVRADYQDGILKVTLPKTESAKPRQIKVSVK